MGRTDLRLALAASALLAGCGDRPAPARMLKVISDTVAGVPRVISIGRPPSWTLELEVEIGAVEAGPESFGRIRSVLLGSRDEIYVADWFATRIQVFDSAGDTLVAPPQPGGLSNTVVCPYPDPGGIAFIEIR